MADPIPRFEIGDTRQFVVTYSTAPVTTPRFTIFAGSGAATTVYSVTCTSSSSTGWFAFWTLTANSPNAVYAYQFTASYADGQVLNRGLFHAVKTTPIG